MSSFSKVALSAVLITYFFVGIDFSKKQGFWHDEIYTLTFLKGVSIYVFSGGVWKNQDGIYEVNHFKRLLAADHFYANLKTQILHEGHPPLYFLLLKAWSYVFGCSELALRSFSLSCGILSFIVLFTLFRRKAKHWYTSWGVLFMLVFNPFLFYFFTEARMYALSFLFACICFTYWFDYQKERKLMSRSFLFFCISSICLLYTHYYGLFFLSSLGLLELFKFGFKRTLLYNLIAFAFFIPWCIVLRQQLILHDVHWTDGIISFGESIQGYLNGIAQLLISPSADLKKYELIGIIFIFIFLLMYLFKARRKAACYLLFTFLFYGIQIYLFDQITGHHSILVSRYYMFLLLFIYWGIYKLFDEIYRFQSLALFFSYSIFAAASLFQVLRLERAPKQMFREVATYIDRDFDPKKNMIVIEPKGPLLVGLAYYLQRNFVLVSAEKAQINSYSSPVYVDEMLGLSNFENKFHNDLQKELHLVPFVGVFLYR